MGNLICQKCNEGFLYWIDTHVHDLEDPMKCKSCGYVYETGMKEFTEFYKESEKENDSS
jgi:hypothetical protein